MRGVSMAPSQPSKPVNRTNCGTPPMKQALTAMPLTMEAWMTPEALAVYLRDRYHLAPDLVQSVIVKYLEAPKPIRHPKSWGYRVAMNLYLSAVREVQGHETQLLEDDRSGSGVMVDPTPSPLRVAMAREQLDAYAANPTVTARAKGRGKPGINKVGQPLTRPDKWGFREDYNVLRRDR